jgi:hypothetical protein
MSMNLQQTFENLANNEDFKSYSKDIILGADQTIDYNQTSLAMKKRADKANPVILRKDISRLMNSLILHKEILSLEFWWMHSNTIDNMIIMHLIFMRMYYINTYKKEPGIGDTPASVIIVERHMQNLRPRFKVFEQEMQATLHKSKVFHLFYTGGVPSSEKEEMVINRASSAVVAASAATSPNSAAPELVVNASK